MNRKLSIGIVLLIAILFVGSILLVWGVSIYNKIIGLDEGVKSGWSQVESQYQRRYDLIPNLVETVKGFAKQEREVLENVTNARARVGQISVTPEVLNDPQAFARFQQAQDGLSAALSRLLAVVENYPTLKSNENFLQLQSQLEGTENRITVARNRFNEAVQQHNTTLRRFPGSVVAGFAGFREAQYFQAQAGAEEVPQVRF
ncbi:MAG: LemA family protein [Ignavibacteriales bacterium]|nr:LemA family protein [Ignavibacteriales bacterium]